jgi:hypothetical protein
MSKILEESLCPPCFTSTEEYYNMYLSRKWLDCVEMIRSVDDGYGVDTENALTFLYAIANEVANQVEKVKAKAVCPVCGYNPCACATQQTTYSVADAPAANLPTTKPAEVTIDFAAEEKVAESIERLKYMAGIRG